MEEKTPSSDIDFQVRVLSKGDYASLANFSCGVDSLDDFFHWEIEECVRRHYLTAYGGFIGTDKPIAIFTLMNDSIMIDNSSEKEDFIEDLRWETSKDTIDFFTRQPSYPSINIGHLGISCEYQGQGIGTAILDLVADTFAKYRQAGCQFITVDALNNTRTIRFYRENQFSFQTNRDFYFSTRRMYRILDFTDDI